MEKLTEEQRVQRAHVWLMKNPKYCLYSGIFMLGKTEVLDNIPTACTDGRNVMYGRAFMAKLSEPEVRAVILHENLHKAFRHLTMWERLYAEHATLANMACDYVINILIYDSDPSGTDVRLPSEGLLDFKYRGWDARTVFDDLKQQCKKKGSCTVKTQGNQQGTEKQVDPNNGDQPGTQPQPGQGGGQPGTGQPQSQPNGGMDHHDWENAKAMSDAEKEMLARDVDQALRQGAILAGKMKGNMPREIEELLEAKVDWREAMREFITSLCVDKDLSTWKKPSRRWIAQDVYMPSLIGESVGRIVVAVDTSGSIDDTQIAQFLGEVSAICEHVRPDGIDLLYWDHHVAQHEKYDHDQLENLVASTRPKGGGGTSPTCITEYLKDHRLKPECAVILTDGITGGDWGADWPCPTLWGITTDMVAGVGKTVQIR
jgi:predicted metal-dependent peptidase